MASKITIKRSLTAAAPAGLSFGEMAFVQGSGLTANQLYVGISGGNPAWVGAQIGTTGTWTDNAAKTSLATQFAIEERIGAKISAQTAGVSSFNGVTGAVTGVSSFNGLTGAVSGVTTSVANTFTAVNTFSAGIVVSAGLTATNINTTGFVSINNTPATLTTTTSGNATVFNSVATSLGIGGAATAITMGAATGTINIRNPTIQVGNTVATINTASGTGNTLTISPYGSFIVSPTSTSILGGTRPSLIVTNSDAAGGIVSISGGDLYLGVKTDDNTITTPVSIVFEGTTDNTNETTFTVTDPTADRTITLPDATGTVALTTTVVSSAVAGTGISVSGATGAVTITNIGVRTFNGATGAVTGVSSFNGLTGAVSGVGSIVAGTGISISGATGAVTVNSTYVPALATTGVTGVASFDSGDFAVSGAGAVTIKAAGVGNAQLENPNITINGATIALGTTYNFKISEFGSASSAELAAKLSDTTGSTGGFVRATGPTISAPVISSDTIKNSLGTVANIPTTGAMASLGAGDTFVLLAQGQTLTNKTLTSPAVTTSLTTTSTSFDLLNTTATTVNFAGAGLTLNIGNASGTATFGGNVIVNGDFTVQGNTTTLNTTTLNVEDFNITMGLTLTNASQCTGAGIGIGVGTGITFAYDHSSLGWLSSVNMDLASGKVFKIANASVLSSSALGAGVTGSSLTQVGTITLGTWNGTAITDTYLAQITTGGKVANSATTATNLNTASAIVARDGSGNFTAGTITAALTGNVSGSAATVTTAAQPAITSVGTLTSLTVSGTLEAGLIDGGTF